MPQLAAVALVFAGSSGCLAVALGAWSAHGLADRLPADALGWLRTGLDYQMWHALALLAVAALARAKPPQRALGIAAGGFALGTLLFSGSLYLLAFTGSRGFAQFAPPGGLALLVGWAALAWHGVGCMARRPPMRE